MKTIKNRKTLVILVTMSLFLILLISLWYIRSQLNNKQTPDVVINNFMKAVIDKDAKTATSFMYLGCSKSLDEKIKGLEIRGES